MPYRQDLKNSLFPTKSKYNLLRLEAALYIFQRKKTSTVHHPVSCVVFLEDGSGGW